MWGQAAAATLPPTASPPDRMEEAQPVAAPEGAPVPAPASEVEQEAPPAAPPVPLVVAPPAAALEAGPSQPMAPPPMVMAGNGVLPPMQMPMQPMVGMGEPMGESMNPGDEDDDEEDEEAGAQPAKRKRGGHGRRKIEIEYIEDKIRRHITFSKRKAGISKKAYELSRLTGAQVRRGWRRRGERCAHARCRPPRMFAAMAHDAARARSELST